MKTLNKDATKNSAVVKGLTTLLADTYALLGQTQVAHWNVEGPAFFSLHIAFENQYNELFPAVDEIAERLRALDELAPGGLKTLASLSSISELPIEHMPAKDLVAHLIECNEIVVATSMELRKASEEAGDLETQDMVIARIQVHEKALWMLRSFLKNL
ncbi:DNA starvation/stationary phase protection protein [Luteolibacter pohnpeiensis]|uniref:DNA starvation/stationary phase protection protein n=1 Tax=Luteolibacter pohnpeiensis TaxID=454153 RepID=A0A934SBT9_9BACT|nr:DNA starvation/stationary phase protection protein [Luteolibacter pohnpeiensis]MBK1883029.1 DNA starvation/stationary phase protection protein [Luteolibacter pohnpeiensis]